MEEWRQIEEAIDVAIDLVRKENVSLECEAGDLGLLSLYVGTFILRFITWEDNRRTLEEYKRIVEFVMQCSLRLAVYELELKKEKEEEPQKK